MDYNGRWMTQRNETGLGHGSGAARQYNLSQSEIMWVRPGRSLSEIWNVFPEYQCHIGVLV